MFFYLLHHNSGAKFGSEVGINLFFDHNKITNVGTNVFFENIIKYICYTFCGSAYITLLHIFQNVSSKADAYYY